MAKDFSKYNYAKNALVCSRTYENMELGEGDKIGTCELCDHPVIIPAQGDKVLNHLGINNNKVDLMMCQVCMPEYAAYRESLAPGAMRVQAIDDEHYQTMHKAGWFKSNLMQSRFRRCTCNKKSC